MCESQTTCSPQGNILRHPKKGDSTTQPGNAHTCRLAPGFCDIGIHLTRITITSSPALDTMRISFGSVSALFPCSFPGNCIVKRR